MSSTNDRIAAIVQDVLATHQLPERLEDADRATQHAITREAIAAGVPASKIWQDKLDAQALTIQSASANAEAAAIAQAAPAIH